MEKNKLPRNTKPKDKRQFHLEIPDDVWQRMVEEAGVTWGRTTKFILEAITEKLDRQKTAK
jgi:hypothetical protein